MSKQENPQTNRSDPGFWREVWQQARLVYYLLRDPQVPIYLKLIPFTAVVYLLLPFDILPDIVPVIGQLDDLTALLITSKVFVEMVPPHIVAQHLNKIRQMDGYEVVDTSEGDAPVADKIVIDGEVVQQK